MKRERFDFAFALGSGCANSRLLRERGLQFASFPLDWVGNPSYDLGVGPGLRRTAELVADGFREWFVRGALSRVPQYDSTQHDAYYEAATGFYFAHDFGRGGDFDALYPSVRDKYDRRIKRFLERLAASKRVLVVWISDPRDAGEAGVEDIRFAQEALGRRYPGTDFRFLVISCRPGLPAERAEVVRGEGYESFSFDYRVVTEGRNTWEVRSEAIGPLLDRFSVRDYRSAAEKREGRRQQRKREMEKFKATGYFDCLLSKMQYKLYRSLRRRLERKGVLRGLE